MLNNCFIATGLLTAKCTLLSYSDSLIDYNLHKHLIIIESMWPLNINYLKDVLKYKNINLTHHPYILPSRNSGMLQTLQGKLEVPSHQFFENNCRLPIPHTSIYGAFRSMLPDNDMGKHHCHMWSSLHNTVTALKRFYLSRKLS